MSDVLTRLERLATELPAEIARLEAERGELDETIKRLKALHRKR